jgi:hypothetical protein
MKAHHMKHQKQGHEKRAKRAAKATVRKQLQAKVKTDAATLGSMRKMVEQLGAAGVGGAVETDSPNLYGSEPPAV